MRRALAHSIPSWSDPPHAETPPRASAMSSSRRQRNRGEGAEAWATRRWGLGRCGSELGEQDNDIGGAPSAEARRLRKAAARRPIRASVTTPRPGRRSGAICGRTAALSHRRPQNSFSRGPPRPGRSTVRRRISRQRSPRQRPRTSRAPTPFTWSDLLSAPRSRPPPTGEAVAVCSARHHAGASAASSTISTSGDVRRRSSRRRKASRGRRSSVAVMLHHRGASAPRRGGAAL